MRGRLILILGDQLSPGLSALQAGDPATDRVLLAEVLAEASHVPHHKKKLAFVFSAMRHFADELRGLGWQVDYVKLDDPGNSGSLGGEVQQALGRHGLTRVLVTEPGEWRLLNEMHGWPDCELLPDHRFLADRHGFADWAEGRKGLRMEHFYRLMRRKTGLLMEGDQPAGGRWNFDAENRSGPPKGLSAPAPAAFPPDSVTRDVIALVEARFADHFGSLETFAWPVTAAEAERAAEAFLAEKATELRPDQLEKVADRLAIS